MKYHAIDIIGPPISYPRDPGGEKATLPKGRRAPTPGEHPLSFPGGWVLNRMPQGLGNRMGEPPIPTLAPPTSSPFSNPPILLPHPLSTRVLSLLRCGYPTKFSPYLPTSLPETYHRWLSILLSPRPTWLLLRAPTCSPGFHRLKQLGHCGGIPVKTSPLSPSSYPRTISPVFLLPVCPEHPTTNTKPLLLQPLRR